MKCYLNITLLPNADITLYFLWEKLYQQLHLALVESQDADGKVSIGVAFPDYDSEKNQLGNKLRVFAPSQEILEKLKINEWLSRMSDYVHISSIHNVPEKMEGYIFFKRIQPKGSNARLARRKAKRENMSCVAALSYFMDREEQASKLPFIRIKSQSSGKRYRLIIARENAGDSQTMDGFSSYGLSSKSSVPNF
ncbi:MAG: type I-F CRISPR-associated endoribonuclease Cas6/Csy4 [Methylococcales bacterium]